MDNSPDRYNEDDGYFYDCEGIRYKFNVNGMGRFMFSFARFTFKFNSMFRVWTHKCLLDMFGIIFVRVDDSNKSDNVNPDKLVDSYSKPIKPTPTVLKVSESSDKDTKVKFKGN